MGEKMKLELSFWDTALLLVLVTVLTSIISSVIISGEIDVFRPFRERTVYVTPDFNNTNVTGYYVHGEYFLVQTRDKTFEEIAETTFHELAHMYVFRNPEHYCSRYCDYLSGVE